jgi:hypothetical protein
MDKTERATRDVLKKLNESEDFKEPSVELMKQLARCASIEQVVDLISAHLFSAELALATFGDREILDATHSRVRAALRCLDDSLPRKRLVNRH